MRRLLLTALLCWGCEGPQPAIPRAGSVRGELQLTEGSRGAAWLFLYPPGNGFPLTQAFPEALSAVSDARISRGDPRFVFARVPANSYRLWGFLDTNLDFDREVDVLGGPGAGDRVAEGVELNLEPGGEVEVSLEMGRHLRHEPPAFVLEGEQGVVEFPDRVRGVHALHLRADALGLLDPSRTGFVVTPAGEGTQMELFPRIYLRFLPRPGQVVPQDRYGNDAEVIVPLLFDPGPFGVLLAASPTGEVVVQRLTAYLLPQAQAVTFEPGRGRVLTPMEAIPIGEYELWVVSGSGQFWRMPNDLGKDRAAHLGGPFASQAVGFRFVRGR